MCVCVCECVERNESYKSVCISLRYLGLHEAVLVFVFSFPVVYHIFSVSPIFLAFRFSDILSFFFCFTTTRDLPPSVFTFLSGIDRSRRENCRTGRYTGGFRGGKKEGRARIPGVGGVEPREGIPLSPRFPEDPPRAE